MLTHHFVLYRISAFFLLFFDDDDGIVYEISFLNTDIYRPVRSLCMVNIYSSSILQIYDLLIFSVIFKYYINADLYDSTKSK